MRMHAQNAVGRRVAKMEEKMLVETVDYVEAHSTVGWCAVLKENE
jgi:hypothetical protein